jgi:hypothetical protein
MERRSQKNKRVAALVRISSYGESPKVAIESILRCKEHFCHLHIEAPGFGQDELLYEGWPQDSTRLKVEGIAVTLHNRLDTSNIKQRLLIEIPPHIQLSKPGLKELLQQIKKAENDYPSYTHFALDTVTVVPPFKGDSFLNFLWHVISMLSFGFYFPIVAYERMLRYWLNLRKFHTCHSIRAIRVTQGIHQSIVVEESPVWLLWNRGRYPPVDVPKASIALPPNNWTGLRYALWTIHRHSHLGTGLWWFWFWGYYGNFAFPWWNYTVLGHRLFGAIPVLRSLPVAALPWHPVWIALYCFHTVILFATVRGRFNVPYQDIVWLGYPIFLACFPFLWLYEKFYHPQTTWKVLKEENLKE